MFDFSGYFKSFFSAYRYKSSAMSSLLWLNGLVTVPCVIGSFFIKDSFRFAPFSVGVVIVLFTLKKFHDLSEKDPRLVQSEWYQIEQHKLDVIAQKGGPVIFEPVNIPLTVPPKELGAGNPGDTDQEGGN